MLLVTLKERWTEACTVAPIASPGDTPADLGQCITPEYQAELETFVLPSDPLKRYLALRYREAIRLAAQCHADVLAFCQKWEMPEGSYAGIFSALDLPQIRWEKCLPVPIVGTLSESDGSPSKVIDAERERQRTWRNTRLRARDNAGQPSTFEDKAMYLAVVGEAVRELRRRERNPSAGAVRRHLATKYGQVDPAQWTRWHQQWGWRTWDDFLRAANRVNIESTTRR